MNRTFRYFLSFMAGSCAGLLAAQALMATVARNGSAPGGELLIIPAIPLILWCGYIFGRETQQHHAYSHGYSDGHLDGSRKEDTHD